MHLPSILRIIAVHNGKISIRNDVKVKIQTFFKCINYRAYSMVEIIPY